MSDISKIVAAHADIVWRTAVKLLSNEEDARDCYQQTFLDAMRLDADTINNWRSVLCSIATRRAIDQLRRRYRDRETFSQNSVEPSEKLPPDRQLIDSELREGVRVALTQIPAKQGEAFWLRHIEHFSPDEIAEQLAVTSQHVRVLVHRAAQHLRTALQTDYGPEISRDGKGEDEHEYK